MRLNGLKDIQSVKSTCSMLYLELKTSILRPLEENDNRHKMNSNNNFKNVWEAVLHRCKVQWISQSVCVTWVICLELCNYSKNFFLIHSFFRNISQCNTEKTSLYELPNRHVFYIKLFVCSFLFKISLRANKCFQWNFAVVCMFIWTIRLLINENWNKGN